MYGSASPDRLGILFCVKPKVDVDSYFLVLSSRIFLLFQFKFCLV